VENRNRYRSSGQRERREGRGKATGLPVYTVACVRHAHDPGRVVADRRVRIVLILRHDTRALTRLFFESSGFNADPLRARARERAGITYASHTHAQFLAYAHTCAPRARATGDVLARAPIRTCVTCRVFYLFYLSAERASPLGPCPNAPHLNPIATTNAGHHSRAVT